jgi:hypothetical protein
MGNVINSIIFFQLADEYREAELNLNNYFLMKDETKAASEEEINDLILSVKNDIEIEKLNTRLQLLNVDDKAKEDVITGNDNNNNNNNNNNAMLVRLVKKPIQQ